MNMLENIRQIGIFMIAAQTVIHFAAGRQYEKYMKIIAGVIVLMQFIRPFVADAEGIAERWQMKTAQIMEQLQAQNGDLQDMTYGINPTEAVIQQIEEEIRERLDAVTAERGCRVVEVSIALREEDRISNTGKGESGGEYVFDRVRIVVQNRAWEDESGEEDRANRADKRADWSGDGENRAENGADWSEDEGQQSAYAEGPPEQGENLSKADGDREIKIEKIVIGQAEGAGQKSVDDNTDSSEDKASDDGAGDMILGDSTDNSTDGRTSSVGRTADRELQRLFAQMLGVAQDRVEVVYLGGW